MKYHQIDRDLFIKTETNLWLKWPKKSCRFNSNDIYPIGADSTMPFEQSRDILLKRRGSGRKHFVIISGRPYEHQKEIFLKETNDHIAVWEGEN
jgi:Xaa-Pro aminopeptidase